MPGPWTAIRKQLHFLPIASMCPVLVLPCRALSTKGFTSEVGLGAIETIHIWSLCISHGSLHSSLNNTELNWSLYKSDTADVRYIMFVVFGCNWEVRPQGHNCISFVVAHLSYHRSAWTGRGSSQLLDLTFTNFAKCRINSLMYAIKLEQWIVIDVVLFMRTFDPASKPCYTMSF